MPLTGVASPASCQVVSTDKIREQFPALLRKHQGLPVAYFDGPGGTQVPRSVADAVAAYLLQHNGNTHWAFPTSVETDAMVAHARLTFASFLNASPEEIAFGANMTTLTFHLARALGREFKTGDEIIVTELDHHANVAPWQALGKERGVIIRVAKLIPETGALDWEDLARLLTKRTKLLAIGAASNALGTVTDVRRAAEMAHAVGAQIFVDAVHYAPHELIDVHAMECDFLSCSAYKFYGPHVGILYGRHDLLRATDFSKLVPAPEVAPDRAETGTQNFEGIAGAAAAVEFLAALATGGSLRQNLEVTYGELHQRGCSLVNRLWHGLAAIKNARLYGPPPGAPRTPTISFTIAGTSAREVARQLVDHGIFASDGDFYARSVAERLSPEGDGFVRLGCSCYTSAGEIERVLESVETIARKQNHPVAAIA